MKNIILSIFLMILFLPLAADDVQDKPKPQTRALSVQEALPFDSLDTSPLLKAFRGLSRESVRQAYMELQQQVDSITETDSLSTGFFAMNWRRIEQFFIDASQEPQKAASLFAPVTLVIIIVIGFPYAIFTFLVPPFMNKVHKPENDPNIKAGDKDDDEPDDVPDDVPDDEPKLT